MDWVARLPAQQRRRAVLGDGDAKGHHAGRCRKGRWPGRFEQARRSRAAVFQGGIEV